MFEGIGLVDGVFEVEAGVVAPSISRRRTLSPRLAGRPPFGRLADADQQDARCERVERPGVADFDFG